MNIKSEDDTIEKKKIIQHIDNSTIERYNKRFEKFGVEARSLGWGSRQDQWIRFQAALRYVNFQGRSVLDVGCGFGDFYEFLTVNGIQLKRYVGIDINEKLLGIAKKRFPKNTFEVRNILLNNYPAEQTEIVTLFGLLNFKLHLMENIEYTQKMIAAAWKITKEELIVDFLSTNLSKTYPEESAVYYHDPKDVLDICFSLSDNVVLVHDYPSIPQKEFLVIIKKEKEKKNK